MRLRKKRTVEGWSESAPETGRLARLRDSIRDDNRAWVASFVGVLLIGICLVVVTAVREPLVEVKRVEPPHNEFAAYTDAAHLKFVGDFNSAMRKRGITLETVFVNSGRIKITVPMETSTDDIVFMSGAAARAVLHRFHNAPYVEVWITDNSVPPKAKQACDTRWVNRLNDFDIKLIRPEGGPKPPSSSTSSGE
jgi:hypothetical protein